MLLHLTQEKETLESVARGDFSHLQKYVKNQIRSNKKDENFIAGVIDTAAINPVWRDRFAKTFAEEMGLKKVNFQVFDEKEKEEIKQYIITGGASQTGYVNLDGLLETTVLPVAEGLMWDNSQILSRVSVIPTNDNDGNQSFDLNEFAAEKEAQNLSEEEAGTEADDTYRDGDTITPKHKIQASTSFTEYALLTLNPDLIAVFFARLLKRVENRLVYNIFRGSNTNNQFKGIINNFGTTVDDQEGALSFSDSMATDNIDLLIRSLGDLPDAVTDAEESRFAFYMTRTDFYQKVLPVQDNTSNYKIPGLITDLPGNRRIAGIPVIFVGYANLSGSVVLADLSNYYVARRGGLRLLNDNGLSNIKTGNITVVAREYADGGMIWAHKNAVGSSANSNDNQAFNMFRVIQLLAA